jgi:hypothetical protein
LLSDRALRTDPEIVDTLTEVECVRKLLDEVQGGRRDCMETAVIALSFITNPTDTDRSLG